LVSAVLSQFEVSLIDNEKDIVAKTTSVAFGKKISEKVGVNQRVQFTFQIENKILGGPLSVQQAVIRLRHTSSEQEAVFVAQPSKKGGYILAVSPNESDELFQNLSGDYEAELIVGDSTLQNPFRWVFATITLSFSESGAVSKIPNKNDPLPEIKHIFREAEKRPPITVSLFFTALSLAPILFLLIGLLIVGANIYNFPWNSVAFFSAVGFQVSLLAILGLFTLFWLELTMVTTLKYLALLAIPTIFFGQRLLRHIATTKIPRQ